MPNTMPGNIQAVMVGSYLYLGGGDGQNAETVMEYSLQTGTWRTLPPYESLYFGMAVVNNQLVLVGGLSASTGRATNILGLWNEQSQSWTHPFPVMPTAKCSVSVVSYKIWLVVAGGSDGKAFLNKVELLDTSSCQWYIAKGSSLPKKCCDLSSVINGNMWYLSGGLFASPTTKLNKCIFTVCLDDIIAQAVSQSAGTTSPPAPSPWQTLPELPVTNSTVLIIKGSLITIGGFPGSAIHLYQPSNKSWIKVGDLPTQRWQCACIVLPSGEIFVAGGYDTKCDNCVYIASIV